MWYLLLSLARDYDYQYSKLFRCKIGFYPFFLSTNASFARTQAREHFSSCMFRETTLYLTKVPYLLPPVHAPLYQR